MVDQGLSSGTISEGVHSFAIRVYFEDTDFSGVVYHANYVKFFERSRSEFLRCLGITHTALDGLETPLVFVVVGLELKFMKPARLDDIVTVKTRLINMRGASFHLDQAMIRGDDKIAHAAIHVAIVDNTGRPRRLPEDIVRRFGPKPQI